MKDSESRMPKLRIQNWGDASGTIQIIDFEKARELAWATGMFVVKDRVVLSFEELEEIASTLYNQGEETLDVLMFMPVIGG